MSYQSFNVTSSLLVLVTLLEYHSKLRGWDLNPGQTYQTAGVKAPSSFTVKTWFLGAERVPSALRLNLNTVLTMSGQNIMTLVIPPVHAEHKAQILHTKRVSSQKI